MTAHRNGDRSGPSGVTPEQAIGDIAYLVAHVGAEAIVSTCIRADGTIGDSEFFASSDQPKNTFPLSQLFYLAVRTGAPAVLVVSTAGGPLDRIHGCDVDFTRRLVAAGREAGIRVHDHVIVDGDLWCSLGESTALLEGDDAA